MREAKLRRTIPPWLRLGAIVRLILRGYARFSIVSPLIALAGSVVVMIPVLLAAEAVARFSGLSADIGVLLAVPLVIWPAIVFMVSGALLIDAIWTYSGVFLILGLPCHFIAKLLERWAAT